MTQPIYCLLVDDLDENLLSLEVLLRREGLVLLKARSGEEALEHLLVHDVALALLDVQMPGMDGFELAEFMRGNERTRRIPIIFVTAGSSDAQRRFRGYEAGAVDFIQKPIEPDILRSKARIFFDLHAQRRQIQTQRDELETYAEALRTANRYKDRILAIVAHELRNPLASMQAGLHLLERTKDPEKATKVSELMNRQVDHLVRLIDDLLDVSSVGEGKILLKRQVIALDEAVQTAIENCRHLIGNAGHELVVEECAEPVWLDADRTRVIQIVSNLLNNAAKYTQTGGRIRLTVRALPRQVEIVVADNGVGIPAGMKSQIFQMFGQIEEHRAHAQGGLGIGLALVRQLVTLHQGTIDVESPGAGGGSSFIVRLPRLAEETAGLQEPGMDARSGA